MMKKGLMISGILIWGVLLTAALNAKAPDGADAELRRLRRENAMLREQIAMLKKGEMPYVRSDIASLRRKVAMLKRADLAFMRSDIASLRKEVAYLTSIVKAGNKKLDHLLVGSRPRFPGGSGTQRRILR